MSAENGAVLKIGVLWSVGALLSSGVLYLAASRFLSSLASSSSSSASATSSSSEKPTRDKVEISTEECTRSLLELLSSISDEQSKRESIIHRGITCNDCGISPIRGYRFKCANCVDYDICEQCESALYSSSSPGSPGDHPRTHVLVKIRIPIPPLANPRSVLLNLFYPGVPYVTTSSNDSSTDTSMDYNETLINEQLLNTTHYDYLELKQLLEQYRSLSTRTDMVGGGISRATFDQCLGPLGTDRNMISERIFYLFDQNGDGYIDFVEFVSGLSVFVKGTLEEKTQWAFRGYDIDNDGYISKNDLRTMYKSYFNLSMEMVRDVVRSLEEEIVDQFDDSDQGNKPISSMFTAPIPASSSSNNNTSHSDQEIIPSPNTFIQQSVQRVGMIESVSQDAVDEVVERTFVAFKKNPETDKISYEEFCKFVENDATLLSWLDSLGTIF